MQQRGKHTTIKIEELLGNCVSFGFAPGLHNEDPVTAELKYLRETVQTRVEDGCEEMAASSRET
jgi:hypothetical protein